MHEVDAVALKWARMKEKGFASYASEHRSTLTRRIRRGVPPEYRWQLWTVLLGYKERYSSGLYQRLCRSPSSFARMINIDVPRTFGCPDSPIILATSKSGNNISSLANEDLNCQLMGSLERILNAYATLCPHIGYCQGMNFVVGFILHIAYMDRILELPVEHRSWRNLSAGVETALEEEAFWVFVCLMDRLEGFYADGFPMLQVYTRAFEVLLQEQLPDLFQHMMLEFELNCSIFLHQWLLSLFVYCLPLDTVAVLWDLIVADGVTELLCISAAVLKILRPALLTMQLDDSVRFFKSMKATDDCDPVLIGRLLLKRAADFKPHVNDVLRRISLSDGCCCDSESTERSAGQARDSSLETRDRSLETRDRSLEARDRSLEARDRSLEMRDSSRSSPILKGHHAPVTNSPDSKPILDFSSAWTNFSQAVTKSLTALSSRDTSPAVDISPTAAAGLPEAVGLPSAPETKVNGGAVNGDKSVSNAGASGGTPSTTKPNSAPRQSFWSSLSFYSGYADSATKQDEDS